MFKKTKQKTPKKELWTAINRRKLANAMGKSVEVRLVDTKPVRAMALTNDEYADKISRRNGKS